MTLKVESRTQIHSSFLLYFLLSILLNLMLAGVCTMALKPWVLVRLFGVEMWQWEEDVT